MDIQVLKAVVHPGSIQVHLAVVEWQAVVPMPCFRGL